MAKKSKKKEDESKKVVAKCDTPNEVVAICDHPEEVIANCENPQLAVANRDHKSVDIKSMIRPIRGQQVMLDFELAMLYGVETKVLNQAVKRNLIRFPDVFMFQLTKNVLESLMSQIVTSNSLENQQDINWKSQTQKNHDRFLIIDDDVYLLGASVKDMGVGMCAVTKMEASPETVLQLLK